MIARVFGPALGLLAASTGVTAIAARSAPAEAPAAAVLFAPWTSEADREQVVADAGGVFLRTGVASAIWVIGGAPGVPARLRAAGATIVLDARTDWICGNQR